MRSSAMLSLFSLLMQLMLLMLLSLPAYSSQGSPANRYTLHFSASFDDTDFAKVAIEVSQSGGPVRAINLQAARPRYELLSAEGDAEQSGGRISWRPPSDGGSLHYRVAVNHQRPTSKGEQRRDAAKTDTWMVMRLGDLFPPARFRTIKVADGLQGSSELSLSGPASWSFETRYGPVATIPRQLPLQLPSSKRRYNRPTGWLVAGHIGVRRETIAGRKVTFAAPAHMGFARLDTLTFLNWTLPELSRVFDTLPAKLLIAGAPRAMWRGSLSGPGSLYLHIDRPLVSENATSSLIHELVHVAGIHSAVDGGDWIVEGLAEYYSLLVLMRSGGISEKRFNRAIQQQLAWAERENAVLSHPSSGANTARAVVVLHKLAGELASCGASIDAVTQALIAGGRIGPAALREITERLLGKPSTTLDKYLPD